MESDWSNSKQLRRLKPKKTYNLKLESTQQTFSRIILFILSVVSFCYGIWWIVRCFTIPSNFQKLLNSSKQNFNPLSVQRYLTYLSVCFSTIIFCSLNLSSALDFLLKKVHLYLFWEVIDDNQHVICTSHRINFFPPNIWMYIV